MGQRDEPLKASFMQTVCRHRLCLPLVFLGMAAGIVTTVPVVLLSKSVRDIFPPQMKWWQTTVLYQIYPRSFKDSNGDGIGDLQGITSKLDYLASINVKAIWISPFYPSPMLDFGYDISNYTDVDPVFGNLTDFNELVKKAHSLGIRVVIDFVPGHTSSKHPWFQNSAKKIEPYTDYYIWANGTQLQNGTRMPPSNWVSVFEGSAWTWNNERQQYYYHAFLPEQPTLNYRSPKVVQEMKDTIRFWLDQGVDGIRADAVAHIMVYSDYYRDQLLSNVPGAQPYQRSYYITNLTDNQPELHTVVKGWRDVLNSYEDSKDDDTDTSKALIVEVYAPPEIRNIYFDDGADMPFNFDLLTALNSSKFCDALCIRNVVQNEYDTLPGGKWANFVSNHDNHRASTRRGARDIDAMLVLLLTLRGTPTIYYGEEIGMEDVPVSYNETQDPPAQRLGPARYMEISRDPERSPMQWDSSPNAGFTNDTVRPWLPVASDHSQVNVKSQNASANATTLKMFRELAFLREEPSLRYGLLTFCKVTPNILSYLRAAHEMTNYLVVINFGNETVTENLSGDPVNKGLGRIKVSSTAAANEGRFVTDRTVQLSALTLKPGDAVVLEL
ncbi:hypothetical protein C0Q70_05877 [Pomacea canaliculata]|uniref:Glycosyl hydrolase family 13 catalytic domain-containing protein n=1 Tax=Pomacea canaliculata TaxID=400727 RepID=A0A2T7PMF6_POMCA|nr:hypothetical protein C0Q70_05877 [Pomacea canaliculata]